ncbi:unnamed protein product [Rhizoctonia solani]|uniref:BTB domain-containing protein n=1 Tax=Rhizoctonia solani TaxID=456999 RepID=A0A8H2WWB7_9AGAM|nr:unnamed protein product [Rhizoctonia solani]
MRPLFEVSKGGDLTVRPTDNVTICAHSTLLRLASSVLDAMLFNCTAADVLKLSENAVDLSIIFEFIYPTKNPTMASCEILDNCLKLAQKYDIQSVFAKLDTSLQTPFFQPAARLSTCAAVPAAECQGGGCVGLWGK